MDSVATDSFISRWAQSGGAERANYQLFLTELCDLLEVPRPDTTWPEADSRSSPTKKSSSASSPLGHDRAEEEKRGLIRYLRPPFQKQNGPNPTGTTQQTLATTGDEKEEPAATPAKPNKIKKQPWPKSLSEQASAVQAALTQHVAPADETDLAKYFTRANKERIAELLETLASLGRARELGDGRYVGV